MAGKINVPITTSVQGLANTQRQLATLGKSIGTIGKTAGISAIAFGAFTAGIKGADFAVNAIAGARDLERNLAGVATVFDELAPRMTQFSKDAVSMGLGVTDAAKAVTFIGSVLKQSGFSIEETADLTERLIGLATDLSITYGYDVQEALLGMTALFRGEYDPIEKFGVAMKQSEINSELAAQKMGHLEGAQRRLAEQQVRVQLLFERSADAQGAMARQSGTLAVEQLKLAATFETLRDTVAVSMLPVISEALTEMSTILIDLQPVLKEAFDAAAPVVERMADQLIPMMAEGLIAFINGLTLTLDLFNEILDPATAIGESFAAIGANFNSLMTTIFGRGVEAEDVFNAMGVALGFIADMISDIIRFIDITIIGFKAMGEMIYALVTGDLETFMTTDWGLMIRGQIAVRDAFVAQQLAAAALNSELAGVEERLRNMRSNQAKAYSESYAFLESIGAVARRSAARTLGGGGGEETAGGAAKNYVEDFFEGMKDEIAKQQARMKLESLGASEGLIDSIIGGQGWEKVFSTVLKSGRKGIKDLQRDFDRTAAGVQEIEQERKKIAEAAEQAAEAARKELEKLQEAYQDVLDATSQLKDELKEIGGIDILPTFETEIGRFESAIVGSFERIQSTLRNGFVSGAILQQDLNAITAWASAEAIALQAVAKKRDELAQRYDLAEALISEYRTAFTGALQLTSIIGQLEKKTREMTVTQVTEGVTNIGASLRELRFSLTKSYTETIEETVNKTQALTENFKDVALKARTFAENLRRLRDLGLDPQLFNQLVQAGVEAGGETAQALVDGGSATINEINGLFQEIDQLGYDLGTEVAKTMYGTGIDMADGLLAGIRSRQAELEATARQMAEAFNNTFNGAVNVATDRAEAVVNTSNIQAQIDAITDKLAFAQKRLQEESEKLSKAKDKELRESISKKINSYTSQIADFLSQIAALQLSLTEANTAVNAPQVLPSSAGMVSAQSAGVTQNISVNVSVDATKSPAQVGQAVAGAISAFGSQGGVVATKSKSISGK